MLQVVHAALPFDGRKWRVEWLGAVRQNPMSPLEPEIELTFRKLGVAPKAPPMDDTHTVFLGMGSFCGLPLGSVWRDGRLVGTSSGLNETYSGLANFDRKRVLPLRDLIPRLCGGPHRFGSFRCGERSLDVPVMVIPIARKEQMVPYVLAIPLFEIARAWFLRDSELTLRLLSGPLKEAIVTLYNSEQTEVGRDRIFLALREGLGTSSVPVVAMLLKDAYAREAAGRIVDRIVRAHAEGSQSFIEAWPPVRGMRQVSALGEWLPVRNQRVFFVYRLIGVELPPMPTIEWFHAMGDDQRIKIVKSTQNPTSLAETPSEVIRVIQKTEPKLNIATHFVQTDAVSWLNAPIIQRLVRPNEPTIIHLGTSENRSRAHDPREAASGIGTSHEEGPPAIRYVSDLHDDVAPRELLPAGFDVVERVARLIGQDQESIVRSVTGRVPLNYLTGFNRTLISASERLWALIEGHRRQALCIEIEAAGDFFYLFEVQRRAISEELAACLLGRLDGSQFSKSDIDRILALVAETRGTWSLIHAPYWRRTLAHKFKDERSFADKVCELIRQRLAQKS